jgi:hypothetical protein
MTFKILVNVYQAVRCHSLENDNRIPNRHANLKSRAHVSIVQGKSDVDWAYLKNSAFVIRLFRKRFSYIADIYYRKYKLFL